MTKSKYRAYSKSKKVMVYGDELVEMGYFISPANGNLVNVNDFSHYINEEWELMEFTGLQDKNGNEIYGGDILRYGKNINVVKYQSCAFHLKDVCQLSCVLNCEVVGNIYRNPEIIKKVK